MKKIILLIISLIYIITLLGCDNYQKELRLRILANSNSQNDQELKIEVKEYIKTYLLNINSKDNLDLKELECKLNDNFDVFIKVERKYVSYEAKTYNNKIIQAGSYDTILITIGEGLGKNFWTILYPEFFNISFDDDTEIEYRSYILDLFS